MRRTSREAEPNVSYSFQLPAPIRGWNARDSIAMMKPGDAIALDNWFPGTTSVNLRPGSTAFATAPETIYTLMGIALPDGTYKQFAATNVGIYDISSGVGVLGIAGTVGKINYVQLNVGGTAYLWCTGEAPFQVRLYNGTTNTWLAMTGATVPAITGVVSNVIRNVSLWKYRLILCVADSMSFYYGPLNSVGGAFTAFDLGSVFKRGGYLMATANWTVDGGDGPDDRFVAITSEGEIAVYSGTDPTSLLTFALVGVYRVGKPVGRKCFVQLAGDLGILTEQGLWPLSQALQSAETDKRAALTDRIQSAFNDYHKLYGTLHGWAMALLPKGPALIVNVPISATVSYQFVMNTITGAWCRFKGWSASTIMVLNGKFYYAIGTQVYEGWTGTADGTSAIDGVAVTAFSPLGGKSRKVKVNLVQPIITVSASVQITMALDTDYNQRTVLAQYLSTGDAGSTFDSALYDAALWDGTPGMAGGWKAVPCPPGKMFSLRLRLFAKNLTAQWAATDYIVEGAGLI